jgi:carbonic anhydrase
MKSLKFLILSVFVVLLTLGGVSSVNARPAPSPTQSVSWSYSGPADPSHWGDLSPEFASCKIGNQQSPVNIVQTKEANLDPIEFNYKDTSLKVINTGRTIQFDYEPGSSIKIGEKQYELLQFHFHDPSEHTVDGKVYPIEGHLVHKSEDGKLAVVGIFLKEGKPNDFIEALWSHIPEQKGEKVVHGVSINASVLPPGDKSYYHYVGSLTTPPCTEGVSWNIMKTPIEVSSGQIAKFTSIYKGIARHVQPLNQRVVEVKDF